MIEPLRRNPLIAALALVCVALAAVVAIEVLTIGGSSGAPAPRKVAASEAKLLPPIAVVSPEAAYPETADRPLWIPTRRPAPPPVVAQASFQRGQFILQGVTIAGDTRIAMLKEKASGRVHRVEKGKEVNGLQLAEVEPERVTLAQGAEREVLELLVQKPGGGAPAAATSLGAVPAASQGPFGSPHPPGTLGAAAPQATAAPPAGITAPQTSMGPLAPTRQFSPPGTPVPGANPSTTTVPQQQSAAPMTPEELLARRRARRTSTP